jgi:hypothetical protein
MIKVNIQSIPYRDKSKEVPCHILSFLELEFGKGKNNSEFISCSLRQNTQRT